MTMVKEKHGVDVLEKCPTGIKGLDEITKGGLPRGRPTLICGSAGSGKTLFAMEFLMRGAMDYGEPGVFMTFEETPEDLAKNFISLGFDLHDMVSRGLIAMDHVYIERSQIEETGEYDLEGLFIRLGSAIDSVGAKRVVLDTIEALFSGLSNAAILRAELRPIPSRSMYGSWQRPIETLRKRSARAGFGRTFTIGSTSSPSPSLHYGSGKKISL